MVGQDPLGAGTQHPTCRRAGHLHKSRGRMWGFRLAPPCSEGTHVTNLRGNEKVCFSKISASLGRYRGKSRESNLIKMLSTFRSWSGHNALNHSKLLCTTAARFPCVSQVVVVYSASMPPPLPPESSMYSPVSSASDGSDGDRARLLLGSFDRHLGTAPSGPATFACIV